MRYRAGSGKSLPYLTRTEMFWHIDDKTAVKLLSQLEDDIPSAQNHEALAIQLVRQHTRILVPRLYQTWSHHLEEGMTRLITDFVKGERLDHAWPKLSWFARARMAWTLRSYVRLLRNIKSECRSSPVFSVHARFAAKGTCGPFGGGMAHFLMLQPCSHTSNPPMHVREGREDSCLRRL